MHLTPPCPECSAITERIEVEGEEVWRCTAPGCGRRTYGTGDPDADDALPPYSETDEDGAVVMYRGNGEVDVEATAENAAQEPPEDDDLVDEEQPAPAAGGEIPEDVRGEDLRPGARGWGTDPGGWGSLPAFERDPAPARPTATITDSDGEVGRADPRPQTRMENAGPSPFPGPSPVGNG